MKRRLWQIFGPVGLAAVLVVGLLLAPLPVSRLSAHRLRADAVSLAPAVMGGQRVKQQALAADYVPFFGSSELARMDPFHPSVLAAKYHRSYQPLLLGMPGTQSLVHFVDDQTMLPQLKNRKAVFIISMQWFTHQGQVPAAFDQYYSPLQLITWMLKARNTASTRYAASRLLKMGAPASNTVLRTGLTRLAAGQPLAGWQRTALATRRQMLGNEDDLFSRLQTSQRWRRIAAGERALPKQDDPAQLEALAQTIGRAHTTSNAFGIDNAFFRRKLGGNRLAQLRGSQRGFDYRQGPEYGDFELLLQQFARNNTTVQFVIPPINHKWAEYTGLPLTNYAQAVAKLKYQLRSQGFTHVLDLSNAGQQPYFMQDTIHLGWAGWLAVDRTVKPFLTQQQPPAHYALSDRFYGKAWANQPTVG